MRKDKLLVVLLCAVAVLIAKDRDWQVGKVLDSRSARTYVQTGSSATATTAGTISPDYGAGSAVNTNTSVETQVHHMAVQETQLLILGKEYAYIVQDSVQKSVGLPTNGVLTRAIVNRKHGCRYVVNDDIRYSQDKGKLYVIDTDGKQCKLDIIRQEHLTH